MCRSFMTISCFTISIFLLSHRFAFAVDSEKYVGQIHEQGMYEFVRHIIENSRSLQYGMSPQEQKLFLQDVAENSRDKINYVKASCTKSIIAINYCTIEVAYDDTTNLLFVTSANDRDDSIYEIHLVNLDIANVAKAAMAVNDLLDNTEMDVIVVDDMRNTLQNMFNKKEVKCMDEYEIALASKARSLPSFISKRLSDIATESRKNYNDAMSHLSVDGEVKYLGSKNLIGQHRISLYGVPTIWGPLVVSVHYVLLESGPVVGNVWLTTGIGARQYLNDYRKVFSATVKALSQGAVK